MQQKYIRNFSIIAHIDHGKTTLTDRLLELTGAVTDRTKKERLLDSNPIEQERGITIKLAPVSLNYELDGHPYTLNLIDTPGHIDFNYEVERSLAACEGAILLVDATKGVQAQTLANLRLAQTQNITIIPVVNKIDADLAEVDKTIDSLKSLFPNQQDFLKVSAKTGLNTKEILNTVIKDIPAPSGDEDKPLRALVFNSYFHPHLGVIAFVRIVDGSLSKNTKISFVQGHHDLVPKQIGVLDPALVEVNHLSTGQVGFIATGLKDLSDIKVGDTLTLPEYKTTVTPLPGYRHIRPNVYLEIYPTDTAEYQTLLDAIGKLKLSDSALTYTPTASPSMGNGVRVGFLGLLHSDVIKERLQREFNLPVTYTSPSVEYQIDTTDGRSYTINRAPDYPDPSTIKEIREPISLVTVLTPKDYVGPLIQVLENKRGHMLDTRYLPHAVQLDYAIPLIEVITGLQDAVKSVSQGYATFDYQPFDYYPVKLSKLDVYLNKELVEPLSTLVVTEKAESYGRKLATHLKDTIDRHQFEIPIQVAVGGNIIARETIKAFRKDVTAKLYGGDVTRRNKLLDKQKKGKKRMKSFGAVNVPPDAFKPPF